MNEPRFKLGDRIRPVGCESQLTATGNIDERGRIEVWDTTIVPKSFDPEDLIPLDAAAEELAQAAIAARKLQQDDDEETNQPGGGYLDRLAQNNYGLSRRIGESDGQLRARLTRMLRGNTP